jgi:hypothetical protein
MSHLTEDTPQASAQANGSQDLAEVSTTNPAIKFRV